MENAKLSSQEAISFILILILNTIVFSADKIIAQDISSAALINSIYITILALIITFVITVLYKNFVGYDILDISETIGGKVLKIIIGIIYMLYFVLLSSIILRKISDCLQIIYYPMTNIVYIIVLFIIATGIICSFKNHGIFKANKIFSIIISIVPVCSLICGVCIYGNALGYKVNVENIMPVFVGVIILVLGFILPKCKQNYTVGIKLPWTLHDEENWDKTHKLAGKLWIYGGIIMTIAGLFNLTFLFMAIIFALVIIPTGYSYWLYSSFLSMFLKLISVWSSFKSNCCNSEILVLPSSRGITSYFLQRYAAVPTA